MAPEIHTRGPCRARRLIAACLLLCLALVAGIPGAWRARAQVPAQSSGAANPAAKPDPKKAKLAAEQGSNAERQSDWEAAYTDYTDAANFAPGNREYAIRREVARGRLVQSKMDAAERDAISGRLDEAQKLLLSASFVDPLNAAVRKRLAELATLQLGQTHPKQDVELSPEPRLEYQTGPRNFDYRGDTQGAYQELARQFGVEVAFDVDLPQRQVRFRIDGVNFPTAARLLGDMTGTFWRPLTSRLFFVVGNTPDKRRQYEPSVVRTVLLPASATPEQMTEVTRLVRDLTGITRTALDTNTRTLTLRASPRAVSLASDLIDDLERPTGELILEMEILEVDRTYAQNLGLTPPQSSQAFTLSWEQIREAEASAQGLINVIQQVLGSSAPDVIAFGGGLSTYFATLPGASVDFAQMLSLVRHGRRVLLRAQDGRPADFFVGERVPVQLINYSPSLVPGAAPTAPVENPLVNYATGNTPDFITTASLRGGGTFNDLIVANSADNTVSVLLGNGDGTFQPQTAYKLAAPGDADPVWIATGVFGNQSSNLDLAVANKASNNVSILLGQNDPVTGAANGTFAPGGDITTGLGPVSVVAANFHGSSGFLDLAVANQGDNTVSVFTGNADGSFTAPASAIRLAANFQPTALATGNFTNSGNVDLVVLEESTTAGAAGNVEIFLGNGDGTFTEKPNSALVAGNAPSFVATGDFNGDGVLDLAIANSGAPTGTVSGNSVGIYLGIQSTTQPGIGNGTFAAPTFFPAGNTPTSLAVADYNLDSLPDIAVTDSTDDAVTILFNQGSAVFGTILPEIPVGTAPASIVTADFNVDGRPDAAVANSGSANATVILNTSTLFPTGNGLSGTQFPNAEYIDVGLKVKATPRIHPNNEVTLDLNFDISSLAAQSVNAIPIVNSEVVKQTVRLKQDETAVVAGFRSRQLSNAIIGNPGISEIPGLGLLDENNNTQNEDSQLLILVTPRLVRLAPRQDHSIYAGQGSLEGPGEPAPVFVPPPQPPGPTPPPAPAAQPPQTTPQPGAQPEQPPEFQRPQR